MADKEALTVRAKILGVLLRDARLAAGKSLKDCANVLGSSSEAYAAYELGRKALSLPELEIMAYFLDRPLSHFWGDEIISQGDPTGELDADELLAIRHRIIGAQLRQARQARGMSLKELGAAVGLTPGRLSKYELGERPIPIPELETLAFVLGVTIDHFIEKRGPVGEWDANRRAFEQFSRLPADIREFILQPINESYLRLAMRMSELSVEKMRAVAEGLLDITY